MSRTRARSRGSRSSTRYVPFSIECQSLNLAASRRGEPPLPILSNVSMTVRAGEFVSVVGPSGCGKSTILNAIAGFGLPGGLDGQVLIDSRERTSYQAGLAYMQQQDALLPWRTVRENVALAADLSGATDRSWVDQQIADVDLHGFEDVYPHQLSGGMRKRAQLAQLLAQRPAALLMDEPFGALDYFTKLEMHRLFIERWREEQCSVIFVTHDLNEAITLADRIVVLSRRPATVIDEISVDLPRPRDQRTLLSNPRYQEVHERLWDRLGVSQSEGDEVVGS